MRKHVATILGFLTTPLFAAIALVATGMTTGDLLEMWTHLGWVLIFYCYTLGVTLIIGLPVYLFLRHFNKVTWWSAILVGIFSGAVMGFIFSGVGKAFIFKPLTLSFIVVGGLSGLVFWLIWRRGHEEKSSWESMESVSIDSSRA